MTDALASVGLTFSLVGFVCGFIQPLKLGGILVPIGLTLIWLAYRRVK